MRFVSQEVWFDKGFVIRNLLNYCLVQIVSLWSLSIGVGIIFTTNELVDRIRNFKSNASWLKKILYGKMRCRPNLLWNKMRRRQCLSNKMCRRPDFLTKSEWVLCPLDIVCNFFSEITAQNLLLLIHELMDSLIPFINSLIINGLKNQWINLWPAYSTFVFPTDRSQALGKTHSVKAWWTHLFVCL